MTNRIAPQTVTTTAPLTVTVYAGYNRYVPVRIGKGAEIQVEITNALWRVTLPNGRKGSATGKAVMAATA